MKSVRPKNDFWMRLGETVSLLGGGVFTLTIGLSLLGASFVCGIGGGVVFSQYPTAAGILAITAVILFVVAGAICYRGFDKLWNLDQRDSANSSDSENLELPDKNDEVRPDLPPTYLDRLARTSKDTVLKEVVKNDSSEPL